MYLGMGITCLDVLDDTLRIPLGKRRLGGDGNAGDLLWCECELIHIGLCFNEAPMSWYLSHDALWFRVSFLANVLTISHRPRSLHCKFDQHITQVIRSIETDSRQQTCKIFNRRIPCKIGDQERSTSSVASLCNACCRHPRNSMRRGQYAY